jgi:DNA-binding NarL/FixJ family response regulator
MTVRVLIADDQALVRTGFRMILETEPEIAVVGEAVDGEDAVAMAAATKPDVVLMDIRMPRLDGISATRRICSPAGAPRVLILTTYDLDEYVYDAIRAGASGFLLKDAPADQLVTGIRVIARGDGLLAPSVTRRLIEEFAKRESVPQLGGDLALLTDREREVLTLISRGLSNAEIAGALVLGETTVKTHVARILDKLGLRDRVQAVVFAYEVGLARPRAH